LGGKAEYAAPTELGIFFLAGGYKYVAPMALPATRSMPLPANPHQTGFFNREPPKYPNKNLRGHGWTSRKLKQ
jgi:hypothetical protein